MQRKTQNPSDVLNVYGQFVWEDEDASNSDIEVPEW